MAHAAAGNAGSVTIATIAVGRLLEWRARETGVTAEDTAAGDGATSRVPLRVDWEFECRGEIVSGTVPTGAVPLPASIINTSVAIAAKRITADSAAAFAATGCFREFEYRSGGVDGIQEFTATAHSTEGTVPTWTL